MSGEAGEQDRVTLASGIASRGLSQVLEPLVVRQEEIVFFLSIVLVLRIFPSLKV